MKHTSQTLERPESPGAERLHVAIIASSDGVLSTLVVRGREELDARLSRYVERHATQRLWPEDAALVLALIADQRRAEAIGLYFDRVGSRWDREILHREVVEVD